MGIAGFFLWLQRRYRSIITPVKSPTDAHAAIPTVVPPDPLSPLSPLEKPEGETEATTNAEAQNRRRGPPPREAQPIPRIDNLYLDMNGLIHPCCHDCAPKPEPESEEEMILRIFETIDSLVAIVKPRQALIMCIDGVAPRSKMNQQRARRYRSAQERQDSVKIHEECCNKIAEQYGLPSPPFHQRWDHNVITPATAFMERVGQAIEWYILKRLNSDDPVWQNLTVVYSDAHVPGEGEHKMMHYIRGLRTQPGYDPKTSHCLFGMDADLIVLGLATHETNFYILRNELNEQMQPTQDRYCVVSIRHLRSLLMRDFEGLGRDFDLERVIDDFVFLCFFIGNDFLPRVPLIDIKCKGLETVLGVYVRGWQDTYYLTKGGEIRFDRFQIFLRRAVEEGLVDLLDLKRDNGWMIEKATTEVAKKVDEIKGQITSAVAAIPRDADKKTMEVAASEICNLEIKIVKERRRVVAGQQPLGFTWGEGEYRDKYYERRMRWPPPKQTQAEVSGKQSKAHRTEGDGVRRRNDDNDEAIKPSLSALHVTQRRPTDPFEVKISECVRQYLIGMQWVMRYYTKGCPSWEWFYPYHFAPLLQDIAVYCDAKSLNTNMRPGAPLHPVEQLLAVLPRESVHALPEELHGAVMDEKSILAKYFPASFEVDFAEATYSWHGVPLLPFINVKSLQKACGQVVTLEPDMGWTLLFTRNDSKVGNIISKLLQGCTIDTPPVPIPPQLCSAVPVAGRIGRFKHAWPLGAKLECDDRGLADEAVEEAVPIAKNTVVAYYYEMRLHADYLQRTLDGALPTKHLRPLQDRQHQREEFDPTAPAPPPPPTPPTAPTNKTEVKKEDEGHNKKKADDENKDADEKNKKRGTSVDRAPPSKKGGKRERHTEEKKEQQVVPPTPPQPASATPPAKPRGKRGRSAGADKKKRGRD